MGRPINFEYQTIGNVTIVALDSKLADYDIQPTTENGEVVMKIPEKTIKDCRNIDGCIYLHLGRAPEHVINDLIEKFWKLRKEKGWKQDVGIVVPDHKFNFN